MTAFFTHLAAHPRMVLLGWSALLVLCQTVAAAAVLAGWRELRPRASSRALYTAAVTALSVCVALAILTPAALWWWVNTSASPSQEIRGAAGVAARTLATAIGAAAPLSHSQGAAAIELASRVGWLGLLWVAGIAVLGARLLGGWAIAEHIRRTARPVRLRSVCDCELDVRLDGLIDRPVTLLESARVEAPVVIGWRRPVIVLPRDAAGQLPPGAIRPLVAHEMAHVARRDYLVNLAHAFADVLLFFSPAALWISARAREAREYCCDDIAVRACGDVRAYVQALTAIAGLRTVQQVRPALGAAGPRLVTRIRRLLREDEMSNRHSVRLTALVFSLLAAAATGIGVTAASLDRLSVPESHNIGQNGSRVGDGEIRISFAYEQPGSGVRTPSWIASAAHGCDQAVLHNDNTVPIVEVTFVGIVSSRGGKRAPVAIFPGGPVAADIPAGGSASVRANLVSYDEAIAANPGPVQIMCALQHLRFANGAEWHVTPNPAATTAEEALSLPRTGIPRSLVVAVAPIPSSAGRPMCRDDHDRLYSPGAIAGIRLEPGHVARCTDGQWVEAPSSLP